MEQAFNLSRKFQSAPSSDELICPPDVLFDKKQVTADIRKVFDANMKTGRRAEIAAVLRDTYTQGRAAIREAYEKAPFETHRVTTSYTYLTDQVVCEAFKVAATMLHPNPEDDKHSRVCMIAVGGYGRAEMAPHSDVDLLFLTPQRLTEWTETVVESILYMLWDVKLKVGHATRSIDECVKLGKTDLTIRTALLESRYLAGKKTLSNQLDRRLWKELFSKTGPEFVEQKLIEREDRHTKQGGQRFMLEPNVKEGKGGLRDLQTLFWITKYLSHAENPEEMIQQGYFTAEEHEQFFEAQEFLWTVRCHLHLITKRATEQLTFDTQIEVAEALGYEDQDGQRGVEKFMQDYFRHATKVGDLTRIFLTALEAQHVKKQPHFGKRLMQAVGWGREKVAAGYAVQHGRITFDNENTVFDDPLNILRIFQEALRSEILIHPDAMRLISANLDLIDDDFRTNPEAIAIFLDTLIEQGNPERALRRMNELGVLGAFVPEFQRIIAMMQFNVYHHYTVDEHTIQCISNLAQIERGELQEDLPIVSRLLERGVNRRIIYVALLLHDIGKGLPEDHSIAGARMAGTIAPRLGLNAAETETVIWLIRNHLLMSDVAQKRDLSDPRTVRDFIRVVKSSSRLNLLTILTVCDIRGVGPETWNNWKAQLIRTLYHASAQVFKDGMDKLTNAHRLDESKAALQTALGSEHKKLYEAEDERHYDPYWQGLDTAAHIIFAHLFSKMGHEEMAIDIVPDIDRDATRACFVMQDHPGIFSRLAGALALVGANVVDARTYTTADGYATAVFWIQDADEKPYEMGRIDRLKSMILKTLKGEVIARDALKSRDKLKKRERDFIVPTEITFDNEGSEIYTIIEVDTRDRPGLLHDLTLTLRNANIYIASAVIATYGVQAVDVFYVKDTFGLKLHAQSKRDAIEKKLRDAIAKGAKGAMS
ncbi:[protein-PII] uridylyltransferase [Amylibacter sp. SFDW26]|uniref:[protein-PII] uridylyltransferase n=1 Tax=Amylibacter sp. SFDW26 TaxID=2652722 RepID=UPI001262959B|nr:[protein-PII] uridylyltransferase [Amylibacter sp. SFDW26]KAB7613317.1 [protein-PII] uridylyltransferase [Amylibacter sp. SFDW26]